MSDHDAELSRLRNENRNLQARLYNLQAENNTLRVQLQAGLSVISYLEQRLQFHLKSLVEQESATAVGGMMLAGIKDPESPTRMLCNEKSEMEKYYVA